jgi:hypothetical protein
MREPFSRHARLLAGVERWRKAESEYNAAQTTRCQNIRQARDDGYQLRQIGDAYGLTTRRVEQILKGATA